MGEIIPVVEIAIFSTSSSCSIASKADAPDVETAHSRHPSAGDGHRRLDLLDEWGLPGGRDLHLRHVVVVLGTTDPIDACRGRDYPDRLVGITFIPGTFQGDA
jgi:hypothetical protein